MLPMSLPLSITMTDNNAIPFRCFRRKVLETGGTSRNGRLDAKAPSLFPYGCGLGCGDGRGLCVALGVAVGVAVGVPVGVAVEVAVGVVVGVAVGVGVGVGSNT